MYPGFKNHYCPQKNADRIGIISIPLESNAFQLVRLVSNPHLLSDSEILLALKEMYACLRAGGGCILTTRQYDQEARGKGIFKPFGIREEGHRRYIIFQVWDFEGEQ